MFFCKCYIFSTSIDTVIHAEWPEKVYINNLLAVHAIDENKKIDL